MNFDFAALDNQDVQLSVDVTKDNACLEEKSYRPEEKRKININDNIDELIEKYKNEPKVIYGSENIYATFDKSTNEVVIKIKDKSISFIDKEFFEDAVFNSNTRHEKKMKIINKYNELSSEKDKIEVLK